MATIKPTGNRLGSGWLMLFALPFAAVGVGAFVWAVWTVISWNEIGGWTAVSAEVVSATLEQHTGDDSTTYEAKATYRYEFGGQEHTSSRVAIDGGADNIGDFQQRVYAQLRAAQESHTPVTAYVDPANPADAVLNRELRWGMLTLKGVFALVFGAVGFGLVFGARFAARKHAAEAALREQFPAEPWRWRPERATTRIAATAGTAAYAAIGFAVLWNLVSLPALLFVPGEIASGNAAAAVALLFPLVGLGLAARAIRAWLQLKRFKVATLTLNRTPVALGGQLKGSIRVEAEIPVAADFRLELECCEERTRGTGKNRRTTKHLLWQKQWRVPRHQCQISSSFTTIPVEVAVPSDQPAVSTEDGRDKISWRLEITGECAGPDFWSRFELPVFDTGEAPASASDRAVTATPFAAARPDARALADHGIDYSMRTDGAETWTFRRGRHKALAATISVFAAIWTIACAVLFMTDAPVLIAIVFSLFDALFLWWALSLWFTEHRVMLHRGVLTLERRGFIARAPVEIPVQWIRIVNVKRGMQAGDKLYYDLEVETNEGTHTAASSLADYDVASWLAQRWKVGVTGSGFATGEARA